MKYLRAFFAWLFAWMAQPSPALLERHSAAAPAPAPQPQPAPSEPPPPPPSPYDAAREQHAHLKAEWDKGKAKIITLREAFAAENCVFYTLADMGDVSRIRQVKLQEFMNRVAFGITPHYLAQHEAALEKAVKADDHKRMKSLSMELISRYKAAPTLLSICELGVVLVFRHDENPYTFNPVIHAEKVKLMQMNAEAQLFFCEMGWAILEHTARGQAKSGAPYLMDKLEEWGITLIEDFHIFMEDELEHGKNRQR